VVLSVIKQKKKKSIKKKTKTFVFIWSNVYIFRFLFSPLSFLLYFLLCCLFTFILNRLIPVPVCVPIADHFRKLHWTHHNYKLKNLPPTNFYSIIIIGM
jgi:hypothetical protein